MLPPSKKPPPIMTNSRTRPAMSGAFSSASAMFVSGPSVQSVTVPAGSRRSVSTMKSTACCSSSFIAGSCSSGPSRPVLPWTCSAVTSGRAIGLSAPAKTFTSGREQNSRMMRALVEVRDSGTLPATVVMPRISSSGLPSASMMAAASSWPGSVSMMIFRGSDMPLPFLRISCFQPAPRERSGDYICNAAFRKRLAPGSRNHHIAAVGMPKPGPAKVA